MRDVIVNDRLTIAQGCLQSNSNTRTFAFFGSLVMRERDDSWDRHELEATSGKICACARAAPSPFVGLLRGPLRRSRLVPAPPGTGERQGVV
jgi:hypothetical protein